MEAAAREALSLKAACARAETATNDLKTEAAAAAAEGERLAKSAAARLA